MIFKQLAFQDSRQAKTIAAAGEHIVNDCAERAVKLATDFKLAQTPVEEQGQLIFQVAEHHRKQIPALHKMNFVFNEHTFIALICKR